MTSRYLVVSLVFVAVAWCRADDPKVRPLHDVLVTGKHVKTSEEELSGLFFGAARKLLIDRRSGAYVRELSYERRGAADVYRGRLERAYRMSIEEEAGKPTKLKLAPTKADGTTFDEFIVRVFVGEEKEIPTKDDLTKLLKSPESLDRLVSAYRKGDEWMVGSRLVDLLWIGDGALASVTIKEDDLGAVLRLTSPEMELVAESGRNGIVVHSVRAVASPPPR